MLAVGTVKRIPPADFCVNDSLTATRTRLSRFLKDMTPMDRLSFATEQIPLRATQSNSF
jgi:hypothetical protein